jgi:hypothetical protein
LTDLPENYENLTDIQKIEDVHFPALKGGKGYEPKSKATIEYNCLAWALGIDWTRYDPAPHCPGYYWFPNVEREWTLKAIRKLVEFHDYKVCDSYELEDAYEKVVFYIDDDGVPQHFARQLSNGKWTSKLGELNDIEHDSLDSLIVPDYGKPQLVLKRRRREGGASVKIPPGTAL